jgi:acyl-coenzyme A synthetase/AMP-(fatty) acid ligase
VEHRQAVNFLQGMVQNWKIGPSDVVLQFGSFSFDASVMDMFTPLLGGAKVVLAAKQTLHSPPRLAALMRAAGVTFVLLPPAVLSLLGDEQFEDLRVLMTGGEELPSDVARSWVRPGLRFVNAYGPTEATVIATCQELDGSVYPPPIGRPNLPGQQAYVLDAQLNPVPAGVAGELHIGGAGVTRGYLNRPELTAERFIADPFSGESGARLYKTGDLVRRRADGSIVFAGRIDDQVKIRGLRIELGEIETALCAHPAVARAVVAVLTDPSGDKQLAAYVCPGQGADHNPADLREHLERTLPAYMIPAHVTALDTFPLNASGKVDKAALPRPDTLTATAGRVPPRTLIETVLADMFATLLGLEEVGATDSFFDIGGSSLQAMRLITMLDTELEVDIGIVEVFVAATPRQLAALLRDTHGLEDTDLDADGSKEPGQLADEQAGPVLTPSSSR